MVVRLLPIPRSRRVVLDWSAIAKGNGHSDDLAVGWKGLASLFLESLHGVHELKFVIGVLFLERGRVDSLASFLASSPFRCGLLGAVRNPASVCPGDCRELPTLAAVATLVKQGI